MTHTPLKPPLTFAAQAKKLLTRGLTDCSQSELELFLQKVNYYRLNAYFHDEINPATDLFRQPLSFNTLKNRYLIDAWLRKLILLTLEPIELKLRTVLAYWSAEFYGSDMFYSSACFRNKEKWDEVFKNFEKIKSSHSGTIDPVLLHHKNKYGGDFPIWVVVEYLSFGDSSKLFNNSQHGVAKKVSESFNKLPKPLAISWIHSSSVLRNICAHYGVLYNRRFSVPPKTAYHEKYLDFSYNNKLFPYLIVLKGLSESEDWLRTKNILVKRVDESPDFNFTAYGFPEDWKKFL